jgi:hypothetical protein
MIDTKFNDHSGKVYVDHFARARKMIDTKFNDHSGNVHVDHFARAKWLILALG